MSDTKDRKPAAVVRKTGKGKFRDVFGIDTRSLAVFRMAMAVLILVDLAIRLGDRHAMYTDDGMFSRAEICRRATTVWNWSFHFASGSSDYQIFLFALAGILGVALLLGWQTRMAVVGSWLMLLSLQHRVPPILSGAEILQRALMFWAMFLPLGSAWSIDEHLRRRRGTSVIAPGGAVVLSMASVAILVQMGLMYFFSAIFKTNASWLSGTAIAGSLAHSFYASPLGDHLLHFPKILSLVTWGVLVLEWAAGFLLFGPRRTATLRLWTIASLVVMHLTIALVMEVGAFSYVAMAGLTLFLPPAFWNSRWLKKWFHGAPTHDQPRLVPAPRSIFYQVNQALCCGFLAYVLAVNLNSLPSRPLAPLTPETWRPFTRGLGLSQSWGMFAAVPSMDGWYVARAILKDGSEVDLLRGGAPLDWKKPRYPALLYPNRFWTKLFREMSYADEQGFQLFRQPVAEFLCRDWNRLHSPDKRIAEFELVFCMEEKLRTPRIHREQFVHLELD